MNPNDLAHFHHAVRAEQERIRLADAERRIIAEFLTDCGPEDQRDPIGWLISVHHELVKQLNEAQAALARARGDA